MNITRLDNNGQRFDVDETGSNYINHLHDTVDDLVYALEAARRVLPPLRAYAKRHPESTPTVDEADAALDLLQRTLNKATRTKVF